MNRTLLFILFPILICTLNFCHRNQLKLNQQKLMEEILKEEKSDSGKTAVREGIRSGSVRAGALYKENRSINPVSPPVVIDISGNLDNTADLKLSDVATEIRYIVIDSVPDSRIPNDMKFSFHLTENYIIASNLYGIHLYSKDGNYLRSVVKNEITGVIVRPNAIMFYTDYTLKGGGLDQRSAGDSLFYYYSNTTTGEKYIMKYDCSSIPTTPQYKFDPENPNRISGLGTIAVDLNHGNTQPFHPASHRGMFGGSPDFLHSTGYSAFMLDKSSYAVHTGRDDLLTILNNRGDTLTTFIRFEKVVNNSKPLQRGTDADLEYEFNGKLYFRPEFNDTLFHVEPPDRMVPLYILNLGKYKVSMQEGVDPDFDLTGKIIPGDWAETERFIFFTFAKDGYDCLNSRKNKSVRIYHALYFKRTGKMVVIKGDPFNYTPEILENDIDGGVPVWPSFYMMGNNGEILYSLKGREIKDRVRSSYFHTSKASPDKKLQLEKLAASVSDNSNILMIIK